MFLAAPTYTAETFEPGEAEADAVLLAGGGRPAEEVSYTTRVESADRGFRMTISLTVRGEDGFVEEVEDVHDCGLFAEAAWREALRAAGLEAEAVASDGPWTMFVGVHP